MISLLLLSIAFLASIKLACVTPFAAFAAFAALTMHTRQSILATLAVVGVNQLAGFGFLHYPLDLPTLMWGPVFAVAAVAACLAVMVIPEQVRLYLSLPIALAVQQMGVAIYSIVVCHVPYDLTLIFALGELNVIFFISMILLDVGLRTFKTVMAERIEHSIAPWRY